MRLTISGLVAAFAVVTVSAVPALACGGGLFSGSCSPCGQTYVEPCAQPQVYVPPAPVYTGCNTGCGGWGHERLADPETQYYAAPTQHQYYYANQGPTYSGPGNFAPYPTYRETAVSGWSGYRHHRHHYGYGGLEGPRFYGYGTHHYRPWHTHGYRYGYTPRTSYAPRFYTMHHHNMRYGMPMRMPRYYGHREMHEHMMGRYN